MSVNDILIGVIFAVSAALLLYWFWPGAAFCVKCGSELAVREECYCTNPMCRYATQQQTYRVRG